MIERPERPYSDAELRFAEAYREHLAVGDPEPSAAGLDPERAELIRRELQRRWRGLVRRITSRGR